MEAVPAPSEATQPGPARTACLPSGLEEIPAGCFRDHQALGSVDFGPDSRLVKIGSLAFESSSIARVAIPRAVTVLCAKCRAVRTPSE